METNNANNKRSRKNNAILEVRFNDHVHDYVAARFMASTGYFHSVMQRSHHQESYH